MRLKKFNGGFIIKTLRNIVLVLFIVVFISSVYNFVKKRPVTTEAAIMSSAVSSVDFKGVFIRDEKPLTFSGNGVLSYNISDGGKVGINTTIAEVYPNDEQIGRNREIAGLEKELSILRKIQNPGTLESAQPTSLSENINETYRSLIYSRDMKDYSKLRDNMENLLVQMSTYQIITKSVTGFEQQIDDINAKLSELRAASVVPSELIKSNESAYFVSYCDGYESVFTTDSIETISAADIKNVVDKRSSDANIVGKMVYGYKWYFAGVVNNEKRDYIVGNHVRLKFDSFEKVFDAVIAEVHNDGNLEESVVVLECGDFNYDLLQHRSENAKIIKGEYTGLKVPKDGRRFVEIEENVYDESGNKTGSSISNNGGVYVLKGEQIVFKKIDVLYENGEYAISKVHEEDSSYLSLYDDIIIQGGNKK